AGVKIAMGTDAGVFKHGTNLRELELMVESGATPMDAIVMSTKNAAECMEIENLGLVKEGYIADLDRKSTRLNSSHVSISYAVFYHRELQSFPTRRSSDLAGVKIAMGTDAGVFKHGTNLRELELMVESGATPMDAIVMSTKNAAECMEIENLGLVKEGYIAD